MNIFLQQHTVQYWVAYLYSISQIQIQLRVFEQGGSLSKKALKNVLTNVKAFDTMTPTNVITNVKKQFNANGNPAYSEIQTEKTQRNKKRMTKKEAP